MSSSPNNVEELHNKIVPNLYAIVAGLLFIGSTLITENAATTANILNSSGQVQPGIIYAFETAKIYGILGFISAGMGMASALKGLFRPLKINK